MSWIESESTCQETSQKMSDESARQTRNIMHCSRLLCTFPQLQTLWQLFPSLSFSLQIHCEFSIVHRRELFPFRELEWSCKVTNNSTKINFHEPMSRDTRTRLWLISVPWQRFLPKIITITVFAEILQLAVVGASQLFYSSRYESHKIKFMMIYDIVRCCLKISWLLR